jgi:hypothetical protein
MNLTQDRSRIVLSNGKTLQKRFDGSFSEEVLRPGAINSI